MVAPVPADVSVRQDGKAAPAAGLAWEGGAVPGIAMLRLFRLLLALYRLRCGRSARWRSRSWTQFWTQTTKYTEEWSGTKRTRATKIAQQRRM